MAKMQVKRVGVFSFAKVQAVVLGGIMLIMAIPLGLMMMVVGTAMLSQSGTAGGVGIGIGLFYMVLLPIMGAVMGFVGGALNALVYNIAAGFVGGMEVEMESAAPEYGAPPPPQQWNQYQPGQQAPY